MLIRVHTQKKKVLQYGFVYKTSPPMSLSKLTKAKMNFPANFAKVSTSKFTKHKFGEDKQSWKVEGAP